MTNTSIAAPVSVVIPAHNAEKFIQQAIESVQAQTLSVMELIVVADDCSDDTARIAAELGARVSPIKARNISAARNKGIQTATQKWIALLDADDYWEPNKIEYQWRAIERFPEASVISCDFYLLSEAGISGVSDRDLRERRRIVSDLAVVTKEGTYFPKVDGRVLRWFEVPPQAVLMRRDVFDRAGFFDESLIYLQDIECFARALKDHSLVVIEKPLVYRRFRADSHSANTEGKWASYFSIINLMLRHPDQYPPRAGLEHRENLKRIFASNERAFAEKRRRLSASQNSSRPCSPEGKAQ
jgi:glycosyltransferase involved in cell wall biosynthesis